jgi:endonuclease/exonuclease/phosphatase family metal-dependent hydrolase
MTKVKIGTFNTENLFMRYRLLENVRGDRSGTPIDYDAFNQGGHINMLGWSIDAYGPIGTSARALTAKVILENAPDVLAVQEVENLEALIQFNRKYLDNTYPYLMVIDGNDPRQIDVGVLSRFDFEAIRTHRFEPPGSPFWDRTFSRDCLEVELRIAEGRHLTLLVNHFKSQIGGGEERRKEQADRVTEILKGRFGDTLVGNFVVLGDLNNGPDAPEFDSLMGLGLENVVETRLPTEEHWTHYYKAGKLAEQLDYLLLSPELGANNPDAVPHIERRGLGSDIDYYQGERFDANVTGADGASDHCPVFLELEV